MQVRDMTLGVWEYKGKWTQASDSMCPCRPCYNAHDCGRNETRYTRAGEPYREWAPRMECATRYNDGCPDPMPEPVHVFGKRGRLCKRCGQIVLKGETNDG